VHASLLTSSLLPRLFLPTYQVRWEPLIEKWTVAATLTQRAGGKRFATLKADNVLLINVTDDFMRTILSTYWMLFSEERGHTTSTTTTLGMLNYTFNHLSKSLLLEVALVLH
jgi:hypothetical protein